MYPRNRRYSLRGQCAYWWIRNTRLLFAANVRPTAFSLPQVIIALWLVSMCLFAPLLWVLQTEPVSLGEPFAEAVETNGLKFCVENWGKEEGYRKKVYGECLSVWSMPPAALRHGPPPRATVSRCRVAVIIPLSPPHPPCPSCRSSDCAQPRGEAAHYGALARGSGVKEFVFQARVCQSGPEGVRAVGVDAAPGRPRDPSQ